MDKKTVSVIIPVYNSSSTLERCVSSVLNQNYPNIEVILIDDGSTDSTPKLCDYFAESDDRVKVIHKKNGGVCDARNTGLNICSGEYITFVDQDDYILPGMYSKMVRTIEEENLDVCACQFLRGDANGKIKISRLKRIQPGIYNSLEFERFMVFSDNWIQDGTVCAIWNKLYRKNCIQKIRFSGNWGEDYEFNDKINSKNIRIGLIQEAFYVWVDNPESQSSQKFNSKWNGFLNVILDRMDLFREDQEIVLETKKLFCNVYVEYNMFSFHIKNEGLQQYETRFRTCFYDLRIHNYVDWKFVFRMRLFLISPLCYYLLTRKAWK